MNNFGTFLIRFCWKDLELAVSPTQMQVVYW
jgi:hypothetical protein